MAPADIGNLIVVVYALLCLILFGSGGVLALMSGWRSSRNGLRLPFLMCGMGSTLTLAAGVYFLVSPMREGMAIFTFSPLGLVASISPTDAMVLAFSLELFADRLTGLFFLLAGGVGVAATVYLTAWMKNIPGRSTLVAAYAMLMFFVTMTLLANTTYFFLLFLEGITLSFAYLALFRYNLLLRKGTDKQKVSQQSIRQAMRSFEVYLIFEHFGMMFLLSAMLILSIQELPQPVIETPAGQTAVLHVREPIGFDFDRYRTLDWEAEHPPVPPVTAGLIFLLLLAGFGMKAGMFPAHVWVPMVHPYSPTGIHAVMSGVILKSAGIYGMYRFFFEFLQPAGWWWGGLILLFAGATTLVGVFYALLGRDLKVALASHSVENIGIILAGIGLALLYRWAAVYQGANLGTALGVVFHALERLALTASLYHLVNHSVFKSLLFFCTGAIEDRVGTTRLDKLGGLMRRLPWTSAAFLVGAVSIAGLPPFNGFASEWLVMQSIFSGTDLFLPDFPMRIYLLIVIVVTLLCLSVAFGLTGLAFVKIAGEALLGSPRSPESERAAERGETPRRIRAVLAVLASLCLFLGLFPAQAVEGLSMIAGDFQRSRWSPEALDTWKDVVRTGSMNVEISVPIQQGTRVTVEGTAGAEPSEYRARLSFGMLLLLAILLFLSVALAMRPQWLWRTARFRRGPVWTGGSTYQTGKTQFSGSAFASLIWLPFQTNPVHFSETSAQLADEGFMPAREAITATRGVYEIFRMIYDRGIRIVLRLAQRIGERFQNGDIRRYVFYIFLVFLLALVSLLFLAPGAAP